MKYLTLMFTILLMGCGLELTGTDFDNFEETQRLKLFFVEQEIVNGQQYLIFDKEEIKGSEVAKFYNSTLSKGERFTATFVLTRSSKELVEFTKDEIRID